MTICTLFAIVLRSEEAEIGKEASTEATHLAVALSRDIERNVELFDLSLQAVIEGLEDEDVRNTSPRLRQLILFDRAATAKHLGSILVLNERGSVVLDSRSEVPRQDNLAARDYFHVHVTNPHVGLFISDPYIGHRNGSLLIGLSRRLSYPDGSFAGVVVGTLELAYFSDLFRELQIGSNGSMTLLKSDGTLLMREPMGPGVIGRKFATDELFRRLRERSSGTYEAISPVDNVIRMIHYQQVGALPLVQIVTVATSDIYDAWRRKTGIMVVVLLSVCASMLTLAVVLQRQLRRRVAAETALEKMATTDALTNLPNRRRLDEVLDAEWRRCYRGRKPLSVIMIDVDFFKAYNDREGHQAGDRMLEMIASSIASCLRRPGDLAARYGGEEFAVILPETDAEGAFQLAECIRTRISDKAEPHNGTPAGQVTVSLGVATRIPVSPSLVPTLIAGADRALYSSKANGRNQTTVAKETQLHLVA